MISLHELLDTKIEFEGSLVLLIDTLKEIEQVELESVHLCETLEQLGDLVGSGVLLLDTTKEDLGRGFSNVFTEIFPVTSFVLGDAIINLVININTIEYEVLTNVPSERWESGVVGDDSLEFREVVLEVTTVAHASFNLFD